MKKYLSILALTLVATAAYGDDKVLQVYVCGDDVGILMEREGWMVAVNSQIGPKNVDRILSVGLTLLASGKSTG